MVKPSVLEGNIIVNFKNYLVWYQYDALIM